MISKWIYLLSSILFCSFISSTALAESNNSFIGLDSPFVVNIQGPNGPGLMQAEIQIQTAKENEALIKQNIPLLRNATVLLLSQLNSQALSEPNANASLRQQLQMAYNQTFQKEFHRAPINGVLITNLLVQ